MALSGPRASALSIQRVACISVDGRPSALQDSNFARDLSTALGRISAGDLRPRIFAVLEGAKCPGALEEMLIVWDRAADTTAKVSLTDTLQRELTVLGHRYKGIESLVEDDDWPLPTLMPALPRQVRVGEAAVSSEQVVFYFGFSASAPRAAYLLRASSDVGGHEAQPMVCGVYQEPYGPSATLLLIEREILGTLVEMGTDRDPPAVETMFLLLSQRALGYRPSDLSLDAYTRGAKKGESL